MQNLYKTGTTLVAFKTKDYCIIGSDQQATLGNIATLDTTKVYYISDYLIFAGAGLAAECQYYHHFLKGMYNYYESRLDLRKSIEPLLILLRNKLLEKGGINSAFLIASKTLDNQYKIYTTDSLGSYSEVDYATLGSGGDYSAGILRNGYNSSLPLKQGAELLFKCIKTSKEIDLFSGGKTHAFILSGEKTSEIMSPF
jgi:20S proteasome alpha/beta subunit